MLRRGLILDLGIGLGKLQLALLTPWADAGLLQQLATRDTGLKANGHRTGLGFALGNAFWYDPR
jgi:hypothetical protein